MIKGFADRDTERLFNRERVRRYPAALETVRSFTDAAQVRAALSAHLHHLTWAPDREDVLARGTVTADDALYEFSISIFDAPRAPDAPAGTAAPTVLIVSLHCSGRVDSASFAQRLCDATGWIAFDDRIYLFQPHFPPVPGGHG